MTNFSKVRRVGLFGKIINISLCVFLSFQTFLLSPIVANAVGDSTPPTINSFTTTADGGKFAQEVGGVFYTNDTTPTISATYTDNLGQINALTASVQVGGDPAEFDSRDASGISATLPTLPEGTYAIRVAVSDNAANLTEATKSLVIDTTLPSAPVISTPASITSSNQTPTISGTTEADSTVNIYDGAGLITSDNTTADGTFSVSSPSLSNGSYALTAVAVDRAGNPSTLSNEVDYTVDIVAPTKPILTPIADTNNQLPTFNWSDESASGAVSYQIQISNDNFVTTLYDTELAATGFTPGSALPSDTIYWHVASIDVYGNRSDFSTTDNFVVDSSAPTITGTNLPVLVKAGVLNVDINFSEAMDTAVLPVVTFGTSDLYDQHVVSVSWLDTDTARASIDILAGWDGPNTVVVSGAEDVAGNTMLLNSVSSFYIDTTAPVIAPHSNITVEATSPAGNVVDYTAPDATDTHDGTSSASCLPTSGSTFSIGVTTVTCTKTDAAGNVATSAFTTTVQDTTAPTISDTAPANGSTTSNAYITVSATFHDGGSGIDKSSLLLDINGVAGTTNFVGNTFSFIPNSAYEDGDYTVVVSIADNSGTPMADQTWSFTVSSAPTITGVAASGGRIVANTINSTNTGFSVSGNVVFDIGTQEVDLYVDEGVTPFAKVDVYSPLTTYTITLSPAQLATLSDGTKLLQVMRIGSTYNHSVLSVASDINVDKTLPTTPDETKIAVAQNASGIDDTISGIAGAISLDSTTIILYNGADVELGSYAVSSIDGSFGPLSIGNNINDTVKISTRDAAGNESAQITKTNDIVAPVVPAITSPSGTTYGKVVTLDVSGTAEAGTIVKIYNGSDLLDTTTTIGGNTFAKSITLGADGNYTLSARAVDAAGNISDASNVVTYVFDRVEPTTTSHLPNALTNSNMPLISVTWSETGSGFAADPARTLTLGVLSKTTVWNSVDTMTYTPSSSLADGAHTVTATITDRAGNVGSTTFSFTIDSTKPVISVHADIVVEATSSAGAAVIYTAPNATDNIDATVTATCVSASGSTFPLGPTIVNCNKTDVAGNAATQTSFIVTVQDTTGPTISLLGSNPVTLQVHSAYVESGATASDIVDGDFPATHSGSVTVDTVGSYTITYNAIDSHSNSATPVTRVVNVVDTTAPVIATHADMTEEATSSAGAVVTYTAPNATDNYDADALAVCTPASGLAFPIGTTTVTCNKTDANLNVAVPTTFTVTVQDMTAPTIDSITGTAGTTGESTLVTVNAHDNVAPTSAEISFDDGSIWTPMTGSSSPFTYSVAVSSGSIANINYLVRVYDAVGLNSTSDTQTIIVTDNDAPVAASIAINSDAPYTNNDNVALTLSATDNIGGVPTEMEFSNNGIDSWSGWEAYSISKAYTIVDVDGTQSIYAKFRDAAGIESNIISDSIILDTTLPTITNVTSGMPNGTYKAGDTVSVNVQFSEPVFVTDNSETIELAVSPTARNAVYASGSETNNLTFNYTVQAGDTATDLDFSGFGAYTLNGDAIKDVAGNDATLTLPVPGTAGSLGANKDIKIDAVIPVITPLGVSPVTIEVGTPYIDAGATAYDSVEGDITSRINLINNVNISVIGDYTVTYNISDLIGNAAVEVTRIVHVVDTTIPVITLIGGETTVAQGSTWTDPGYSAADNYDGNITANIVRTGDTVNTAVLGDYTIKYDVSDSSHNAAIPATRTVHVTDQTAPTGVSIAINGGAQYTKAPAPATVTLTLSATDNIAVTQMAFSNDDTTWSTPEAYTVTKTGYSISSANGAKTIWARFYDVTGNVSTPIFSSIIYDSNPPGTISVVNTPALITNNKHIQLSWTAANDTVSGVDHYELNAKEGATVITDINNVNIGLVTNYTLTDTQAGYLTTDANNYTFGVRAVDRAGNNATYKYTSSITIDTISPVITAAANITGVEATSPAGAVVTYDAPNATDNYDADAPAICTPASGSTFPLGITTVACNKTDTAGNPALQTTFTVTVVDTTAPVIAVHADIIVEATSSAGAVVTYTTPNATDNYDTTAPAICTSASGSTFSLGSTLVTCSKTDTNGNLATPITFTVTVVDTTAPVITLLGDANMTVAQGSTWTDPGFTATDNYDGNVHDNVIIGGAVNTTILGDYTLTYDVVDAHGYHATPQARLVHVTDQTPPVVTVNSLITGDLTPPLSGTIDDATATVSVRVNGVDYPATNNGTTWSLADNTIASLADGAYDVAVTATDTLGNVGHDSTTNELAIDNSGPTVTNGSPTGTIGDHRPTVTVVLLDIASGVNVSSVVVRINGIAVATTNNGLNTFYYTPSRDLGSRTYNVTVDGRDNAGNAMTRYSFSFTIE